MLFKTMAAVKKANKKAGLFFFSEGAMGYFKSRVVGNHLYGGRFFITGEIGPNGIEFFTVREVQISARITTPSAFQQFYTVYDAEEFVAEQLKGSSDAY